MSLLDIDKSHSRRLNPTPNGNDKVVDRPAHDTVGHTYTSDGVVSESNVQFKRLQARLDIPAQLVITPALGIQDAVDYVSASGGGVVFLTNGTYTMDSSIVLPSDVTLQGATGGGVTIDFQNTSNNISATGTLITSIGTIAVNNGSTTVTGTGTSWDSSMIGYGIIIRGRWFYITAVASATSLTIDSKFDNVSISGQQYSIADVMGGVTIKDLTVIASTNSNGAVYCRYVDGYNLDGVTVTDSTIGINVRDTTNINLRNFTCISCGVGINMDNVAVGTLYNFYLYNCTTANGVFNLIVNMSVSNFTTSSSTGNNMTMTSCSNWGLYDCANTTAGGKGIEMTSCTDIEIFAQEVQNCASDGIKLSGSCARVSIHNVTLANNTGNGINVSGASNSKNTISMCFFTANGGTVADTGTLTISVNNQT